MVAEVLALGRAVAEHQPGAGGTGLQRGERRALRPARQGDDARAGDRRTQHRRSRVEPIDHDEVGAAETADVVGVGLVAGVADQHQRQPGLAGRDRQHQLVLAVLDAGDAEDVVAEAVGLPEHVGVAVGEVGGVDRVDDQARDRRLGRAEAAVELALVLGQVDHRVGDLADLAQAAEVTRFRLLDRARARAVDEVQTARLGEDRAGVLRRLDLARRAHDLVLPVGSLGEVEQDRREHEGLAERGGAPGDTGGARRRPDVVGVDEVEAGQLRGREGQRLGPGAAVAHQRGGLRHAHARPADDGRFEPRGDQRHRLVGPHGRSGDGRAAADAALCEQLAEQAIVLAGPAVPRDGEHGLAQRHLLAEQPDEQRAQGLRIALFEGMVREIGHPADVGADHRHARGERLEDAHRATLVEGGDQHVVERAVEGRQVGLVDAPAGLGPAVAGEDPLDAGDVHHRVDERLALAAGVVGAADHADAQLRHETVEVDAGQDHRRRFDADLLQDGRGRLGHGDAGVDVLRGADELGPGVGLVLDVREQRDLDRRSALLATTIGDVIVQRRRRIRLGVVRDT